ncbi:hypothetical protein [Neobacillus drentensis]|uniref:hypothetical protein n=1 Tax=Neobacillus drentensis TaxID=220684 RepID=UPI0030017F53
MDKLIEAIHEITENMKRCLDEENFVEFEKLLTERHMLMTRVDELKKKDMNFEYSSSAKQCLKDIQAIDQLMATRVEKSVSETKFLINQMKKQKQVSKQYNPSIKQTNGVFLDSKW